jgi:hypothetical protein
MKPEPRHIECIDPALGELLVPYGLGTLDADEAARFEDHLMECGFCRAELEAGYEVFSTLNESRPELIKQMSEAGEDYEALFGRMRESGAAAKKHFEYPSLLTRWKSIYDMVLRPWVYGPLVAAAAAVILIVHLTGRGPTGQSSIPPHPSAPQTQSYIIQPSPQTGSSNHNMIAPIAPEHSLLKRRSPGPNESLTAQKPAESSSAAKIRAVPSEESALPPSRSNAADMAPPATPQAKEAPLDASADEARVVEYSSVPAVPVAAIRDSVLALLGIIPSRESNKQPIPETAAVHGHDGRESMNGISMLMAEKSSLASGTTQKLGDSASAGEYEAGLDAYHRNDFASAAVLFANSVRKDSANNQAWFYLGAAQLKEQQWGSAMRSLFVADSLTNGTDLQTHYYLSLAAIMNGEFDKAKHWLAPVLLQSDSLGLRAAEVKRLLDNKAPSK